MCIEKGLKSDQAKKGMQVCGRPPVEWGCGGIGQSVKSVPCLGEKYETSGKVCWQGGRHMCLMCVFWKFVGDLIQQVVIKASFVIGPMLGPEGESEMNKTLLQELTVWLGKQIKKPSQCVVKDVDSEQWLWT